MGWKGEIKNDRPIVDVPFNDTCAENNAGAYTKQSVGDNCPTGYANYKTRLHKCSNDISKLSA